MPTKPQGQNQPTAQQLAGIMGPSLPLMGQGPTQAEQVAAQKRNEGIQGRSNMTAMMLELVKVNAIKFGSAEPMDVVTEFTQCVDKLVPWLMDGTPLGNVEKLPD